MTLPEFFAKFPSISQVAVADRAKINRSLMGQYACGLKAPRPARLKKIEAAIHAIGKELTNTKLT